MTNYDELVKRLREQDRLGLFFLPDDHVVVSYGEAASAIEDLQRQLAEKDEALREAVAFVKETFGDLSNWADDAGWTHHACKNDRICERFGPSDFHRAAAIVAKQEKSDA